MIKNASLEIKESANGWVIETDYFCFGGKSTMVFTNWKDVIKFVSKVMYENNPSAGEKR